MVLDDVFLFFERVRVRVRERERELIYICNSIYMQEKYVKEETWQGLELK